MKRTLIAMLAVLAVSLALCWASRALLDGAVDEALALGRMAVQAEEEDRASDARNLIQRLSERWDERAPALELLTSHDALHDVQTAIGEARICLKCEDRDDFLRMMSNLDAALQHIRDAEAVSWGNLY